MARPNRVVSVTVRLIGLGAVAGAVCGAVIPLVVVLLTGPGNLSVLGRAVALSAGFGAVVGSVAGPAVAWGLLRRVTLGRAVLWGTAGTVLGAVVGELNAPRTSFIAVMSWVVVGGVLGLVAASVILRARFGRPADPVPVHEPPNVP